MLKARHTVSKLLVPQLRPAILRKDFIIDEYQLYEAKLYGVCDYIWGLMANV